MYVYRLILLPFLLKKILEEKPSFFFRFYLNKTHQVELKIENMNSIGDYTRMTVKEKLIDNISIRTVQ